MSRAHPGRSLAAVLALLFAIVWRAAWWLPVSPRAEETLNSALVAAVAAIVFVTWWRDGVTPRALGLTPSQWSVGWASIALFSAAGAAVLASLGAALGTISVTPARVGWLVDYVPVIGAQQLLLQGFCVPQIEQLAGGRPQPQRRRATIGCATLAFAALHAPNPALMAGVAIAGAFWVRHFLAYRNLLAVLASHLVLGVTAMAALGPGPMLNLRVGPGAIELLLH